MVDPYDTKLSAQMDLSVFVLHDFHIPSTRGQYHPEHSRNSTEDTVSCLTANQNTASAKQMQMETISEHS